MASTIVTKNSSTASAVPVSGDLTQGELAVNVTDKKLYTKDSGGAVVKLVGGLGNQEANAVAITGGSINGTTVGATTASTGAFTTLSASSTTTLSGGTANGVAYLNGSKVVTTGSALTFDGTNLGLGVTPSTWTLAPAFELKQSGVGVWNSGSNDLYLSNNAYYNSGWKYGTSSVTASQYRQVSGQHQWFSATSGTAGNAITFTQAMTLDASGNLLVGTTNANENAGAGFKLLTSGQVACVTTANTTNAQMSTYELYSTGAGAFRFYVGAGGTIFATSTTITAISDQRFKENIRDLDDGLDVVMALKPRKFDWKEGKGQDIKNARGFIAQEFEEVLPDMIEEWRDPAPEGEEPYKAINANLIPTLVKAIQEQQAIIEQLKADVVALKGA